MTINITTICTAIAFTVIASLITTTAIYKQQSTRLTHENEQLSSEISTLVTQLEQSQTMIANISKQSALAEQTYERQLSARQHASKLTNPHPAVNIATVTPPPVVTAGNKDTKGIDCFNRTIGSDAWNGVSNNKSSLRVPFVATGDIPSLSAREKACVSFPCSMKQSNSTNSSLRGAEQYTLGDNNNEIISKANSDFAIDSINNYWASMLPKADNSTTINAIMPHAVAGDTADAR